MSNDRKPFVWQTAKAALITSVAVALMLPGDWQEQQLPLPILPHKQLRQTQPRQVLKPRIRQRPRLPRSRQWRRSRLYSLH